MAGDIEVVARPHRYSWHAPRWLPVALATGAALWAGSIWWMVANLGGPETSAAGPATLTDEVVVLRTKVEGLTQQTAMLGQEREALAKRVVAIEARPAAPAAATPAAQPGTTAAPDIAQMDPAAAYSIPRPAYLPPAVPQAAPAPTGASASARFFTNGADRYNCTSFGSQAEAQEALAANVPGDPNRLDMNGNGVACEDITYPANTPKNLAPIANR